MVTGVAVADIVKRHPRLYHMASADSWPSIAKHGLLSTSALLELFEIDEARRNTITLQHRPHSVPITHPALGAAIVRDQKPMDDKGLLRSLADGMTPRDWYRLLNGKVFFWPTEERLRTLLEARAYRNSRHTVLVVDTAGLLDAHAPRVALSAINSGATKPFPHPRGASTFLPLQLFPFAELTKHRGKGKAIAELAVEHSVPDIAEHVIEVIESGGEQPDRVIWRPD